MREHSPVFWRRGHLVAMAHPYSGGFVRGESTKQIDVVIDNEISGSIFAPLGAARLSAKSQINDTHAITDAQERHGQFKKIFADLRRVVLINARWPARENDSLRLELANFF